MDWLALASLLKYHHTYQVYLHLMMLSKVILRNLFYVWYVLVFGRVLLFGTGWYYSLKKSLNKLAFSKRLVISMSLTRTRRVIGIFWHFYHFFLKDPINSTEVLLITSSHSLRFPISCILFEYYFSLICLVFV